MKTTITNPTHIIKTAGKLLLGVLLISGALGAKAQLNPFQAMYFQNPCLLYTSPSPRD